MPRVQGGQELTFNATAQLTSTTTRQVWARPPIDVDFQVLMFTASGLIVRFLKVFEKNNYHSIKWVRYLTKASGTYQIRVRRQEFTEDVRLTCLLHPSFEGRWVVHTIRICTIEAVVHPYSVPTNAVFLARNRGNGAEMTHFIFAPRFQVYL